MSLSIIDEHVAVHPVRPSDRTIRIWCVRQVLPGDPPLPLRHGEGLEDACRIRIDLVSH